MSKKKLEALEVEECMHSAQENNEGAYQAIKHYEHLSSLAHEWSSYCEKAIREHIPLINEVKNQSKTIELQKKIIAELEEAVEFYAEHTNWSGYNNYTEKQDSSICSDDAGLCGTTICDKGLYGGKLAREKQRVVAGLKRGLE